MKPLLKVPVRHFAINSTYKMIVYIINTKFPSLHQQLFKLYCQFKTRHLTNGINIGKKGGRGQISNVIIPKRNTAHHTCIPGSCPTQWGWVKSNLTMVSCRVLPRIGMLGWGNLNCNYRSLVSCELFCNFSGPYHTWWIL